METERTPTYVAEDYEMATGRSDVPLSVLEDADMVSSAMIRFGDSAIQFDEMILMPLAPPVYPKTVWSSHIVLILPTRVWCTTTTVNAMCTAIRTARPHISYHPNTPGYYK